MDGSKRFARWLIFTRFQISMLRSNLCDYSDAYIFVKAAITVEDTNNVDEKK